MMLARILVGVRAAARRMVSDWTVVAAAFATIVLAATLLSAGPIYGEAITISAFDRAMENAPTSDSALSISARPFVQDFDTVDQMLNEQVAAALAPTTAPVTGIARTSILEMTTGATEAELVEIWHVDHIADRATLTGGRWPAESGPVELAVPAGVATELGIEVGDTVRLAPRSAPSELAVPVVGIFTFDDVAARVWFSDPMVAEGSIVSGGNSTYGPLISSRESVVEDLFTSRLRVTWRVTPEFGTLNTADLPSFASGLSRLETNLNDRVDETPAITNPEAVTFSLVTTLRDRLGTINESLTVTNSTILAVILQLSLLAIYALVLTSRLVVDTRTSETALARSRGASPVQVTTTAVIEGVLLVAPAVLIGPPLAALVIRALNRFGPLAAIGLTIDPEPNTASFALAGASALLALITLVWPAFRAARAYPDPEGRARRQSGRSSTQKLGIDLVLVVLLVVAVWQLDQLGPQVSATVRGRFGVDPLLVVAPVLGLAAGVVLAMRIVPRVARLSERIVGARVPVVPALALWQVARRPNRYARSALLLMTAVALGVFASSFSASWLGSQQDQASHRVGADLRFIVRNTPDTLTPLHMRAALENVPGVVETLPVTEIRGAVAAGRQAWFVLTDPTTVASVARLRPDLSGDLEGLAQQMVEQRLSLPSVAIPGEPVRLSMTWEATELPDPDNPEDVVEPCPADGRPANCASGQIQVVVSDGSGTLHRLPAGPIFAGHGPTELGVDFLGPAGERPVYPLALTSVEFVTHTGNPFGPEVTDIRSALVSMLSATVVNAAGEETALTMDGSRLSASVQASRTTNLFQRPTVSMATSDASGFTFRFYPGLGDRRNQPGRGELTVAVAPSEPVMPQAFPVIATEALLDDGVWEVGMRVNLRPLGLGTATAEIIGTIPSFPGVDPTPPLVMIMDLGTYQALRFSPGEPIDGPEQFWLTTDSEESVASAITQPPIRAGGIVQRADVVSDLTSDPIALGTVGAFAIGFVAAAVFAIIGFTISAFVSARERLVEFSLLHALGLDRRQLSRWLLLEQSVLVILSLALGLVVGLAIGEFLLPLVTLNQDGSPAVPPLSVQHAWGTVWGFQLALIVVLTISIGMVIASVTRQGVGAGLRFGDEQ